MNGDGHPKVAAARGTGTQDASTPLGEPLLTARQVADWLGFASGTVLDWFEREDLPGFRVGGRVRFRPSEVEQWLEERRA